MPASIGLASTVSAMALFAAARDLDKAVAVGPALSGVGLEEAFARHAARERSTGMSAHAVRKHRDDRCPVCIGSRLAGLRHLPSTPEESRVLLIVPRSFGRAAGMLVG